MIDMIIVAVKKKLLNIVLQKKDVLNGSANNTYRNVSEEEKEVKREYGRNRYRNKLKEVFFSS